MDFNISSYLAKYKNLTPPDDFLKKIFVSVVKEETNIDIKRSDVKISHNTIYISAPPAAKSELHIKKPLILEKIHARLEKKQIFNIR